MTCRYRGVIAVALAAACVLGAVAPAHALGGVDTPNIGTGTSGIAKQTLTLTAGPSGAPNGFTVWWMLESDYYANGNA
jgi:hypothetical protein